MTELLFVLTLGAALCTALLAGTFFAFSMFFMRALGGLAAERGIVAMQATVLAIKKPIFLVLFFGTALLCLVLGVTTILAWREVYAHYAFAGAALFLVGGFGVTMLRSVPLNNALLAWSPDNKDVIERWRRYRLNWVRWNHVRAISTLLACACLVLALAGMGLPF
ncbi:hypothetical protein AUC70_11590 [Methyloceanibacter stevinii]|uniref:DUF1772 domain-containing protein n=1 Tax=Methyloceanibacter stevinii TaxID=1774970 RepID=A0A1E3VJ12_9HYPH|nr:anthrone oxygenase family protein [Methyloceanibacter stevinii]ODR93504.1 hypothetical protein AUC70_11590 [Methyloceanibacter stevinii]